MSHVFVHIFAHIFVHIFGNMLVRIFVHIFVRMFVHIFVRIFVRISVHTCNGMHSPYVSGASRICKQAYIVRMYTQWAYTVVVGGSSSTQ